MISKNAKYFCSEDVSNIENYEEAVSSPEKWHCHHRLELDDNGHRLNTRGELKEKGLYFNRPASELIFLKATDHLKLHMSDEQKERISNVQLKLWKKPSRKRKVRDKYANKRENGEFLTNIEQMKSDDDYREYQKQYKHIWYEQNRATWNEYNYKRKLAKMKIKELEALKNKHENCIKLAEAMGRADRKEKLEKHIQTILEVMNNMRPTEQELLETMWKHDDLRRIIDSDLENG